MTDKKIYPKAEAGWIVNGIIYSPHPYVECTTQDGEKVLVEINIIPSDQQSPAQSDG